MTANYQYNPWPLGKLPEDLQRPELKQLLDNGYTYNDPREVVDIFEKKVAKLTGAKHAVAIDCCSHGIFLCLMYRLEKSPWLSNITNLPIRIPEQTYISVLNQIIHAGFNYELYSKQWSGTYALINTNIIDAAGRFTKDMYVPGKNMVLSFQIKKTLPIGRGGMILTDDKECYDWLRLARYDGRDLSTPYDSKHHVKMIGWHYYMTPEDAARGILLMDMIPENNPDCMKSSMYPSLLNCTHLY